MAHGNGVIVSCVKTEICVSPGESENICFPPKSKLLLDSGKVKAIKDIRIGDNIQVPGSNNSLRFSPVIYLPHSVNRILNSFLEFRTHDSQVLTTTRSHLVFASEECEKNSAFRLLVAEEIEKGMCLQHVSGPGRIIEITKRLHEGVYTIVAEESSGYVFVDGFKVLS